jgi:hypothetical protein
MGITLNVDGVEAWASAAILPPGKHLVTIERAEDGTSSGGNPQVALEMSAVGGEHAGFTVRDWLTITPAALGRVVQFLDAAKIDRPSGDFEFPTTKLPGRKLVVLVKQEPKNDGSGDMRTVVAAYMPADQAGADVPADTAGLGTNGASSKQDEDIPF